MHNTKSVTVVVQRVQMSCNTMVMITTITQLKRFPAHDELGVCNPSRAANTTEQNSQEMKNHTPSASLHSHPSLGSGKGGGLGLGLVSLACLTRPAAAVCRGGETYTNV